MTVKRAIEVLKRLDELYDSLDKKIDSTSVMVIDDKEIQGAAVSIEDLVDIVMFIQDYRALLSNQNVDVKYN